MEIAARGVRCSEGERKGDGERGSDLPGADLCSGQMRAGRCRVEIGIQTKRGKNVLQNFESRRGITFPPSQCQLPLDWRKTFDSPEDKLGEPCVPCTGRHEGNPCTGRNQSKNAERADRLFFDPGNKAREPAGVDDEFMAVRLHRRRVHDEIFIGEIRQFQRFALRERRMPRHAGDERR